MAAIFAAMSAALALVWLRRPRLAGLCLALSLGLTIWLFLYEIHSPEYGYRMPWIRL